MTAEERAIEVNEKIHYPCVIPFEVGLIADAIRAAVAEEREACAKVADEVNQWIGDAIRKRGEHV